MITVNPISPLAKVLPCQVVSLPQLLEIYSISSRAAWCNYVTSVITFFNYFFGWGIALLSISTYHPLFAVRTVKKIYFLTL